MKARILKGGWSWLGVDQRPGDVIDAPSAQWIANRIADGGLVEPVADEPEPPRPEITSVPVSETATIPSPRTGAKKKGMTDA